MPKLFLVPIISLFDVHDVAVRDWLNKVDETILHSHLESIFKLDRFFSESSRRALASADDVHSEILRLLDDINPQAVFLDISIDFVDSRINTIKGLYHLLSSGQSIIKYQPI